MLKLTSIVVGAIAFGAASVQAEPVFIFEQSDGAFAVTAEDGFSRTIAFETVVSFEIGGLAIAEIDGEFVQTFTGGDFDTIEGEATFIGASALDTLTVEFSGELTDDTFSSYSAGWALTGATGAYAIYTSGSGNNSGSFFYTDDDTGRIFSIFQGELIPAPGTLALAGLGLTVAFRRRRA